MSFEKAVRFADAATDRQGKAEALKNTGLIWLRRGKVKQGFRDLATVPGDKP